ncbi:MAG: sialidase family protein [Vicinamibacterales bacterium]|nr:sialidase family protein [Vicinamibacterales bacterium]
MTIALTRHLAATAAGLALAVLGLTSDGEAQPRTPAAITWSSVDFWRGVGGDVEHVTDLLLRDDGRTVWAAFYGEAETAQLATSSDEGRTWRTTAVPGLRQVRSMLALPDGTVLFGGSSDPGRSPLVRLHPGTVTREAQWETCGDAAGSVRLPSVTADAVWDLALDDSGVVYVAVDSLRHDPARSNPAVLRSTDGCRTLDELAPLPGLGALALALDAHGRLYAATAESAEHDDADAAGQGHVYYSDDGGQTWTESGRLDGANKVYRLLVKRDGTVLAGSGLRGEFYRSRDRGQTWTKTTHVPKGVKNFGDPPQPREFDATRVYAVHELPDGTILVGTGNTTGDLFLSPDDGDTWHATGDTGANIVCWAIAQAPDGTIWIGTGSRGGDVLRGRVR